MADYGMQLFNDAGKVIASTGQLNFSLRSSGQITNDQFNPKGENYFCNLVLDTSGMNSPIVFLKPTNADSRVSMLPGSGADFQGGKLSKMWVITKWWNKTVQPIQYYIFDRWIPPATDSYGIRMWDQNKSLTFDSNWYHLLLKKVIWLDPGFPNHAGSGSGSNWTNIGAAGTGNLAVSMPIARQYGYGWFCLTECFHLAGANNEVFVSVVPRGQMLWSGWGSEYLNRNTKSQVMIADVSRLPTSYNPVKVY
ncbi:hypothetical protein UXO11_21285 [Enterobacter wuhouensis]|uniref:hypothetical protein n=1 Tax=Enterobacter wuhouensis TaxID=2529381 RepID=UPI002FD392C2